MDATIDREKKINPVDEYEKETDATGKTSREGQKKKTRKATGRPTVRRKQEEVTTRAAIG